MMISFIIPAYNCEGKLSGCVRSIRNISRYCKIPYEIVIVDDGSTDGTPELCDRLGDVVIHQKNAGVSTARNVGIRNARGEYIIFVDADDTIEPEKLATVLNGLMDHPEADVAAYGIFFDYYKQGKCYRSDVLAPPSDALWSKEECLAELMPLYKTNVLSPVWNKVIRRELLLREKLYFRGDLFLFEDLEYSLRLLAVSDKWFFFREPVYHYYLDELTNHAGGRVKRMESLIPLVNTLEKALNTLGKPWRKQEQQVMLDIHLVLMSQKIGVSDWKTVKRLCQEFAGWVDDHGFLSEIQQNAYAMRLYKKQVSKILLKRTVSRIRHTVAVWLKGIIGDFRKWNNRK